MSNGVASNERIASTGSAKMLNWFPKALAVSENQRRVKSRLCQRFPPSSALKDGRRARRLGLKSFCGPGIAAKAAESRGSDLSRRHSGICGLSRLIGSADGRPLQPEAVGSRRIYQAELPRDVTAPNPHFLSVSGVDAHDRTPCPRRDRGDGPAH